MVKGEKRGAALYLRLSREDGDMAGDSESICNQRELLTRFAQEKGFTVRGEYVDDGYSGTSFERPAFLRMLRDIEAGIIGLVLTKDLSRLGRDYIETGRYLERWFPEHNVRYIAVNDGVDTGESSAANEITPFKAVINDFYARDISKKVRAALDTKRACGKFIGARAPYGYRKDAGDKNHLVPDSEKAEWVRRLFALFLGGETLCGAARRLSALGAPAPSGPGAHWNDATVRRMLTNPAYAGDLAQRRSRKVSYKVKRREALPQEEWLVVHNTHEGLVSRADFDAAQALLARRARHARRGGTYPLAGLVFCGACGCPMTLLRQGAREYLVCSGWKRGAGCAASRCVRADAVLTAVTGALCAAVEGAIQPEDLAAQALLAQRGAQRPEALARALEENGKAALSLYRDKARGIVPEADYIRFAQAMRETETALRTRLAACGERVQREQDDALARAKELLCMEAPERDALALLVERVTVGEHHALTVRFAFCAPEW